MWLDPQKYNCNQTPWILHRVRLHLHRDCYFLVCIALPFYLKRLDTLPISTDNHLATSNLHNIWKLHSDEPQIKPSCSSKETLCVSKDNIWSFPAVLFKFVVDLYSENSRFDLGPPVQILKELENNVLVLSDTEISDEDVPVLCRFFNHPEVVFLVYIFTSALQLTLNFLSKSHGSLSNASKWTEHPARKPSSGVMILLSRLTGVACWRSFLSSLAMRRRSGVFASSPRNSPSRLCPFWGSRWLPVALVSDTFASITFDRQPTDSYLRYLAITWLGFRDCIFGGDEGLRILTHYIGKLNLQVLALEQCQLTDASTVYIASILKVTIVLNLSQYFIDYW